MVLKNIFLAAIVSLEMLGATQVPQRDQKSGLWGYVDTAKNYVIPPLFDTVTPFDRKTAGVCQNGKWGLISISGKIIIDCKYEDIETPYNDLIAAKNGGLWGFINRKEKVVIPFAYDMVSKYFFDGLTTVYDDSLCGLIDQKNNLIIPMKYEETWTLNGGFIMVTMGGKHALFSMEGKQLTDFIYDNFDDSYSDVLLFDIGGRWGIISSAGTTILEPLYSSISDDGYAYNCYSIYLNDSVGLFDAEAGKVILEPTYTGIDYADESDLLYVYKNDLVGIFSISNRTLLVQPQFSSIEYYDRDFYLAYGVDGKMGLINSQGNIILEPLYDYITIEKKEIIASIETSRYELHHFDFDGKKLD